MLLPPCRWDLTQRASDGLDDRRFHDSWWPDDRTSEICWLHPSGVPCLRLNHRATIHGTSKAKSHDYRWVIQWDLHALRHVRHQGTERLREKVFGKSLHARKFALDRFRLRPFFRMLADRLFARIELIYAFTRSQMSSSDTGLSNWSALHAVNAPCFGRPRCFTLPASETMVSCFFPSGITSGSSLLTAPIDLPCVLVL